MLFTEALGIINNHRPVDFRGRQFNWDEPESAKLIAQAKSRANDASRVSRLTEDGKTAVYGHIASAEEKLRTPVTKADIFMILGIEAVGINYGWFNWAGIMAVPIVNLALNSVWRELEIRWHIGRVVKITG